MAQAKKLPKRFQEVALADLEGAIDKLGLSDPSKIAAATREVETLVQGLYSLEAGLMSSWDSPVRREYIKRVHSQLVDLQKDLDLADLSTAHIFGGLLAEPLARILKPQGVASIYPEIAEYLPQHSSRDLDRYFSRRRPGESYEEFYSDDRQRMENVMAHYSVGALSRLLGEIEKPLDDLLAAERLDKGGRHPEPYRYAVIRRAAELYLRATGEPPPKSKSGRFVALCRGILEAVGLPTRGLGDAVVRQLKSRA